MCNCRETEIIKKEDMSIEEKLSIDKLLLLKLEKKCNELLYKEIENNDLRNELNKIRDYFSIKERELILFNPWAVRENKSSFEVITEWEQIKNREINTLEQKNKELQDYIDVMRKKLLSLGINTIISYGKTTFVKIKKGKTKK